MGSSSDQQKSLWISIQFSSKIFCYRATKELSKAGLNLINFCLKNLIMRPLNIVISKYLWIDLSNLVCLWSLIQIQIKFDTEILVFANSHQLNKNSSIIQTRRSNLNLNIKIKIGNSTVNHDYPQRKDLIIYSDERL